MSSAGIAGMCQYGYSQVNILAFTEVFIHKLQLQIMKWIVCRIMMGKFKNILRMLRFIEAEIDLTNKQLIMPSVGFGSAPSLAIDLLIASNGFKRVAFLESKHIEPSVGYLNKNIEDGALGLPAEVYLKGEVLLLQLRSRTRIGRARDFVRELSQVFQKCLEKGVIVLGALPFSMRSDLDIASVSKNIYSHCKGDFANFQKSIESKQFKPATDLIDQDEEPLDILENAGLLKFLLKSEQIPKVASINVFSEEQPDLYAASFLGKSLVQVLGSNQVGQCNSKALE